MIVFSLIPVVGSIGVWGPAAFYLLLSGRIGYGVFLFVYGIIIVNLTDNFLRPLLVEGSSELHPVLVFLGVIGGIYLLGLVGVFIGPLLFGVFRTLIIIAREEYFS
jgi:predicted PurR-regulated permease PerM